MDVADSDPEDSSWSEAWDGDGHAADNITAMGQQNPLQHPKTMEHQIYKSPIKFHKPAEATKEALDGLTACKPLSKDKSAEPSASSGMMSRMALNDNKAGMEGFDREKINAIIYEASKGSKYFENERKKEAQMEKRIAEQQKSVQRLSNKEIQQGCMEADRIAAEMETRRDLSRSIVHIDMDMFYAAVEMRDRPDLKDKPMAVGGNNMLSTSNYAARRFGVRAAMPGFIGRKLCPQLVIVSTNFDKYKAVSKQVRHILSQYDPNFSPMSLDEAYLDFTDHLLQRGLLPTEARKYPKHVDWKTDCCCSFDVRLQNNAGKNGDITTAYANDKEEGIETGEDTVMKFKPVHSELKQQGRESGAVICNACQFTVGNVEQWEEFGVDVEEAVREMRYRIEIRTGLTASAGIAPNTMLSKVCSDKNKPNGQYRIPPNIEAVKAFIDELPIRKVSGIGKVSASMLQSLGVNTCTDLYTQRGLLYHLYSYSSLQHYMQVSLGLGSTRVERDGERKSMSVERTFNEIREPEELLSKCRELSEALAEDLQGEEIMGKTVSIKIKTIAFEVFTRSHTIPEYTDDVELIYLAAKDLLKVEIKACAPQKLRLRLMGVRMSSLIGREQLGKHKQKSISAMFQKMHKKKEDSAIENVIVQQSKSDTTSCITEYESETSAITATSLDVETLEPESNKQQFLCPVCDLTIVCDNLEGFNRHLDDCVIVSPKCVDLETLDRKTRLEAESEKKNVTRKDFIRGSKSSQSTIKHCFEKQSPVKQLNMQVKSDSNSNLMPEFKATLESIDVDEDGNSLSSMKSGLCIDSGGKIEDKKGRNNFCSVDTAGSSCRVSDDAGNSVTSASSPQFSRVSGDASCSVTSAPQFSCPVCGLACDSLPLLNSHLDTCLNMQEDGHTTKKRKIESQGKGSKKMKTSENMQIDRFFKKRQS